MKRAVEIWREATPSQRWTFSGFAVAALMIAVLSGAQLASAYAGARDIARSLENEERLTRAGQALLHTTIAAGIAQRTYLLTGDTRAFEEAERAPEHARRSIEQLASAASAVGLQPARLARVTSAAEQRAHWISRSVALARQGDRSGAIEIVSTGRGDLLLREIQNEVSALTQAAGERRNEAQAARRRGETITVALQLLLTLVFGLALAAASLAALYERIAARRAAAALEKANAELLAARKDADEANATKSRFLAAASHDMRQPLHALALYLASLERRVETPDALRIVRAMDTAVQTMTRMFSALLDLARLEAGVLRPQPVTFQVNDLLADVAGQAREIDPDRPERIRVVPTRLGAVSDVDLLEIVVRNLAVNAAKFAAGGRVLIGCRRSGSDVLIQIHDTGPGIPEDQLQRMFGEFVRGEASRSIEGLGLGLSIVDRLTRLLGHRVVVRSRPGRGTVFTVSVPRLDNQRIAPAAHEEAIAITGARILLVDDEPLVLGAMSGVLTDAGAVVRVASTAQAAVEAARAGAVDLCVLDLYLGGEDGITVLAQIEEAVGERIRCLFITGSTASGALQALRRSGRRWATKPVPATELTRLAAEVLRGPA